MEASGGFQSHSLSHGHATPCIMRSRISARALRALFIIYVILHHSRGKDATCRLRSPFGRNEDEADYTCQLPSGRHEHQSDGEYYNYVPGLCCYDVDKDTVTVFWRCYEGWSPKRFTFLHRGVLKLFVFAWAQIDPVEGTVPSNATYKRGRFRSVDPDGQIYHIHTLRELNENMRCFSGGAQALVFLSKERVNYDPGNVFRPWDRGLHKGDGKDDEFILLEDL